MHKFINFGEATRYYSQRASELLNSGYMMMPNYTIANMVNLETDNLQNY